MKKLLLVIIVSCFLLLQQGCAVKVHEVTFYPLGCSALPIVCAFMEVHDLTPKIESHCLALEDIEYYPESKDGILVFEREIKLWDKKDEHYLIKNYTPGNSYVVKSKIIPMGSGVGPAYFIENFPTTCEK